MKNKNSFCIKIDFITLIALLLISPQILFSQSGYEPVISVMDFKLNNLSEMEGQLFADLISTHIIDTELYRVIDRAQREAILSEIEFSLSGCSDEECQLELGRLLSADQLIVGSLGSIGSRYAVNLKLIYVETGVVYKSESRLYPSLDVLIDDSLKLITNFLDIDVEELPEEIVEETVFDDEADYQNLIFSERDYYTLTLLSKQENAIVYIDRNYSGRITGNRYEQIIKAGRKIGISLGAMGYYSMELDRMEITDDVEIPIEMEPVNRFGVSISTQFNSYFYHLIPNINIYLINDIARLDLGAGAVFETQYEDAEPYYSVYFSTRTYITDRFSLIRPFLGGGFAYFIDKPFWSDIMGSFFNMGIELNIIRQLRVGAGVGFTWYSDFIPNFQIDVTSQF